MHKRTRLAFLAFAVLVTVVVAKLLLPTGRHKAQRPAPPASTEVQSNRGEVSGGDDLSWPASSPGTAAGSSRTWSGETEACVRELVRTACSLDRASRERARKQLVKLGPDSVRYLEQLLETAKHPAELRAIIVVLVLIDTPDAWETVRVAMWGTDKDNRQHIVARGIVDGAGPGMEDKLTDLIESVPEISQRVHAGRKLGELAREGAVTDWVERYYETDDDIQRSQYVEALSNVTNPDAIPELEHFLTESPDEELARSAAYGLARIGTRDSATVIVTEMRRASDDGRRAFLAAALGNIRDREVLASFRQDENETVRRIVEETLDEGSGDTATARENRNTEMQGDDRDPAGRQAGEDRAVSPSAPF